jgi:flavodoxin
MRCNYVVRVIAGKLDLQQPVKATHHEDADRLHSYHHQNTEEIAKVMADELEADFVLVNQAQADTVTTYDLVGFGSGIYGMKFHKTIIKFAEALPVVAEKQAFVFSTSGRGETKHRAAFKELLESRGFAIVGEFSCRDGIRSGR